MSSTQTTGSGNGNGGGLPPDLANPPTELRQLLGVLLAIRDGDFSVRLPGHWTGIEGKIADALNDVVSANQAMAQQVGRVGEVVGKEGKTKQRVRFPRQLGAWAEI